MTTMKNIIKIINSKEGFITAGNHENNWPSCSSNEAGIFRSLSEVIKYFFPESFDFDYSNAELSEQAIAGLEAVRESYNLGASHYIDLKKLNRARLKDTEIRLSDITKRLSEFAKPQAD